MVVSLGGVAMIAQPSFLFGGRGINKLGLVLAIMQVHCIFLNATCALVPYIARFLHYMQVHCIFLNATCALVPYSACFSYCMKVHCIVLIVCALAPYIACCSYYMQVHCTIVIVCVHQVHVLHVAHSTCRCIAYPSQCVCISSKHCMILILHASATCIACR